MAVTEATSSVNAELRLLVQSLMVKDRRPLTLMQTRRTEMESRVKALQGLATRLSSLARTSRVYSGELDGNPFRQFKISGADGTILGATVETGAREGHHAVLVRQLATFHTLSSEAWAADAEVPPDTTDARFTITVGDVTTEVAADLSYATNGEEILRDIASAINACGAAVRATVLDVGNGERRIQVQATGSGLAGRLTEVHDLEGDWLGRLGLTVATGDLGGNGLEQAAQDALIVVNGVEVQSSSNTVSNVIPGTVLVLRSVSENPQNLKIGRDEDVIVANIQSFISQFNGALDEVRSLTQPADSNGANRGVLAGEGAISRLRTIMRDAVARPLEGATGGLDRLSQIGLTTDRQGRLTLSDEQALRSAISANGAAV